MKREETPLEKEVREMHGITPEKLFREQDEESSIVFFITFIVTFGFVVGTSLFYLL